LDETGRFTVLDDVLPKYLEKRAAEYIPGAGNILGRSWLFRLEQILAEDFVLIIEIPRSLMNRGDLNFWFIVVGRVVVNFGIYRERRNNKSAGSIPRLLPQRS
jgi:hypothetical protein